MPQVAVTAINVFLAAAVVSLAVGRGRHRDDPLCPIACFLGLSLVAVLTFTLALAQAPRYALLLTAGCAATIVAAWFGLLFVHRRSDGGDDDHGGGGRGPGGGGRSWVPFPQQPADRADGRLG